MRSFTGNNSNCKKLLTTKICKEFLFFIFLYVYDSKLHLKLWSELYSLKARYALHALHSLTLRPCFETKTLPQLINVWCCYAFKQGKSNHVHTGRRPMIGQTKLFTFLHDAASLHRADIGRILSRWTNLRSIWQSVRWHLRPELKNFQ